MFIFNHIPKTGGVSIYRVIERLVGQDRITAHLSLHEDLGGHLKTGQRRTLQNRPMERNQDKSIYTLRKAAGANIFFESGM